MNEIVKHHYKACGLPNVWIRCRCVIDDAGNKTFIIPNIHGLHKAIAHDVVHSPGTLSGPELKFLRSEMGLTQTQLGELVHRKRLTIARWETEETPIGAVADTLIRSLASDKLKLAKLNPEELSHNWVPSGKAKKATRLNFSVVGEGDVQKAYRLVA